MTGRHEASPLSFRRFLPRRRFLAAGGLATLGLGLPDLLRARAVASEDAAPPARNCIFVVQYGGASQLDTFDPKPAAPEEVRGPYAAIDTTAPGVQLTDMLPRLARQAHHFTLVRSMSHGNSGHDGGMHVCMTGRTRPLESTPYFGSIVARFRPAKRNMPSYVWLQNLAGDVRPWYLTGGFLGPSFGPLVVGKDEDNPASADFRMTAFDPPEGTSVARRNAQFDLLARLDDPQRVAAAAGFRRFQEQALDLVTGPDARRAFDLTDEADATRDRYGRHAFGQNLLMARRLVEAGVRLVTVNAWCGRASTDDVLATQGWDHHGAEVQRCGIYDSGTFGLGFVLPRFDQGLSALLDDLAGRGLLESTLVVVVGEFGRTPRVDSNPFPGRDHWPQCYSALFAGGGVRGGAVHGASDAQGGYVRNRPVSPEDFGATLFHALGIPPETRFGPDGFSERVSDGQPVRELFG
jgi:hypothetical protein